MRYPSFLKTVLTATGLRIFVMLAAGMIVSAIIVNFLFFKLQEQRLEKQVLLHGQTLAKLFANNVQLGVFSNSLELLELPVTSLLLHPDILAIAIYDNDGKQILTREVIPQTEWGGYGAAENSPVIDDRPNASIKDDDNGLIFQEPVILRFSSAPEEDLYFESTAMPAVREIGRVRIKISARLLSEGRKDFIVQSVIVGMAFLAVILPLTFLIVNISTRPLQNLLIRVNEQMGRKSGQSGDIDLLDKTFNALLEELEGSFQTINSLRKDLEQKVELRTAALQTSNVQLQQTVEDLKQAQMQLVHSEKMASLGLLATGLAHEINNALTLIRGSLFPLEKVARHLVGSQQHHVEDQGKAEKLLDELIRYIDTGVQRITLLIKDLTTFARPGKGTRHLVDLHQELEMILRLLNIETRGGRKAIEIRRDFGVLSLISCHGSQIAQVFLNILQNAMQAIKEKGTIHISTAMDGDSVRISIEDNGCGIAPEVLPRIFDPFFTTKDVGCGTGLGLGVCYAIVHEHGGEIKVTSQLGKGTKFIITLPVLADTCEPPNHQDQISNPKIRN